jgi:hypothetical protein
MPQSQLLIRALRAVEKVLTSDSEDLLELARLAAAESGIPVDRILLRMDLSGLDLRGHDIGYLLDKDALYGGARLTDSQRLAFDRAPKSSSRRRVRAKIREIRVGMIADFIDAYEASGSPILDGGGRKLLTAERLRELMLTPVKLQYSGDRPLDEVYLLEVLSGVERWASITNSNFFASLFRLLGELRCPVERAVAEIFEQRYSPIFGSELGGLIAEFQPTSALDTYWITRAFEGSMIARAQQISAKRPVHHYAVEATLDLIPDTSARIDFLGLINFECDNDGAERIATRITRARWPASETQYFLRAKVHPKVRSAIFRQLLRQGEETRIIEVLRWLDDNRGAVGALSLEDAFTHIHNFGVGIRFAEEVGARFADNQMGVVYRALSTLASNDDERQRLARFCERFAFTPSDSRRRRHL